MPRPTKQDIISALEDRWAPSPMFDQADIKPDSEHTLDDVANPLKQAIIYSALGLPLGIALGSAVGPNLYGARAGGWLGTLGAGVYGWQHQRERNKRALRKVLTGKTAELNTESSPMIKKSDLTPEQQAAEIRRAHSAIAASSGGELGGRLVSKLLTGNLTTLLQRKPAQAVARVLGAIENSVFGNPSTVSEKSDARHKYFNNTRAGRSLQEAIRFPIDVYRNAAQTVVDAPLARTYYDVTDAAKGVKLTGGQNAADFAAAITPTDPVASATVLLAAPKLLGAAGRVVAQTRLGAKALEGARSQAVTRAVGKLFSRVPADAPVKDKIKDILLKDVVPSTVGAAAGYELSGVTQHEYSKNYGKTYGKGKDYAYSPTYSKDTADTINKAFDALGHPGIKSPEGMWNPRVQTALLGAAFANPRVASKLFFSPAKTGLRVLPSGEKIIFEEAAKLSPWRIMSAATASTAPTLIASVTDKTKSVVNRAAASEEPIQKTIVKDLTDQLSKKVVAPAIERLDYDFNKRIWPQLRQDLANTYWPQARSSLEQGAVSTLGGLAASIPAYYAVRDMFSNIRPFKANPNSSLPVGQQADKWYAAKKKKESLGRVLGMLATVPAGALGYYLGMKGYDHFTKKSSWDGTFRGALDDNRNFMSALLRARKQEGPIVYPAKGYVPSASPQEKLLDIANSLVGKIPAVVATAGMRKKSGLQADLGSVAAWPGMGNIPVAGPILNTAALLALPAAAGYGVGSLADKLIGTTPDDDELGLSWRKRLLKLGLIGGGIASVPNAVKLYTDLRPAEKSADFTPTSGMAQDCSAAAIPQSMKKQSDWYNPNYPQGYTQSNNVAPSPYFAPMMSPLPTQEMVSTVVTDPYMPFDERLRFNSIIGGAQRRSPWEGIVTWPDVTRAAIGAGAGYVSARLLGKVCDGIFGKLDDSTQTTLNRLGVVGGMLSATGALK